MPSFSGQYLSNENMQEVIRFCHEEGLILFTDEVSSSPGQNGVIHCGTRACSDICKTFTGSENDVYNIVFAHGTVTN